MRVPVLVLVICIPTVGSGQTRYSATLGLTAGTSLVDDRIGRNIRVAQRLAPTATLGVSFPVSARERAGVEVALGLGSVRIEEAGLPTVDGPDYRTLAVTGGVEGPVLQGLSYRGGAGLLKYLPDDTGIFRRGGPLLLLLTGGADYRVPMSGRLGLVARLRYDYQRFSTGALESAGFTRSQDVHRLGLGLGLEYHRP